MQADRHAQLAGMAELVDAPDLGSGVHRTCRFEPCSRYLLSPAISPKHNDQMNELKKRLMTEAGLDEETSQRTIEVMAEYVKEQLPENMRGMVDGLLLGEGGNPLGAISGLFGGS